MELEISPEPSDAERRAILAALAEDERRSGGRAPEPRRHPGVVEPGDPGQDEGDEK